MIWGVGGRACVRAGVHACGCACVQNDKNNADMIIILIIIHHYECVTLLGVKKRKKRCNK